MDTEPIVDNLLLGQINFAIAEGTQLHASLTNRLVYLLLSRIHDGFALAECFAEFGTCQLDIRRGDRPPSCNKLVLMSG